MASFQLLKVVKQSDKEVLSMDKQSEEVFAQKLSVVLKVQKIKSLAKEVNCLYNLIASTNEHLVQVQDSLREELIEIRNNLETIYATYLNKLADLVDVPDEDLD